MANNWDRQLLTALIVVFAMSRTSAQTTMSTILNGSEPPAPPQPKIYPDSMYFLKGETFSLNCTVDYPGYLVTLKWECPRSGLHNIINESNEHQVVGSILYKSITVVNATEAHDGPYRCEAENKWGRKTAKIDKKYLDQPLIKIEHITSATVTTRENMSAKIATKVTAHPPVKYMFYKDNKRIHIDNVKYYLEATKKRWPVLNISKLQVTDSGNYTLVAYNDYNTEANCTYTLLVSAPPVVMFGSENKTYRTVKHSIRDLSCYVTGYPPPKLEWLFTRESTNETETIPSTSEEKTIYEVTSFLAIPATVSGNMTCRATNVYDSRTVTRSITREFLIYEIQGGFGIKNKMEDWYSQNEDITITCVASKYDFVNVSWWGPNREEVVDVVTSRNELSLLATLSMRRVSENDSGEYTCRGVEISGVERNETIEIRVAAIHPPEILMPTADVSKEVYRFQSIQLPCYAEAVPPPEVEWYKDGELLKNNTQNVTLYTNEVNHTKIYTTLMIDDVHEENLGTYECVVMSSGLHRRRTYALTLKVEASHMMIISVIIPIILLLILLVAYLIWRIKKEKEFKRELAAAGLLYFKRGVTKSLNPDLGIDEQAELLPYDEKFEFPPEKLKLGHQLGAGAFGVVYKAEARGIVNAEETTVVAVKMVKKTADNMYIKALASELKIMVHLGKHINIVNLLGACTKNVGKRELIVIVEYCKFGNIHNYMQRHREVFIDQLTDDKEKNLGKVNRGFSCSGGSTGAQSDYFSANNTQDTDHTFLNSANTNRSARKVSEGYVQPEWRTTYESDYSFDGRNPRPLSSRDLLAWAFQIARGMEYLASRKVLHGDLAARNILLAEDNVVKICDFGLARSIYNNDEYQKKENSLLPLKWLAIECMTDRIFSTQSDVWSFGIVLWELFSLAKTPYPNISPQSLLQWLTDGNRLAKPSYADDKLYNVMLRCWEQKPTARPSFGQLQEILGGFLEDNVRNHYVDLNSAYTHMNVKTDGQEDYLAMVCAPDYNNLVTPSPHHYANESSFFPHTPSQVDEEGYLQMSPVSKQNIFDPRMENAKFDFDARKFNPRPSEASSYGSELTPMLTLNNLPKSGSESDHEGSVSPYPNKCTSIKEEDEVFETSQNNAKNTQNTAVTNPTYITFDVDIEKKPKDIINKYINVPNGLVT